MYGFQKIFLDWFDRLPPGQQEAVARLFWFLATEDLSDLALPSPVLVDRFRYYAAEFNPPVRALARLRMIGSLVDFILENVETLLNLPHHGLGSGGKVVSLDRKQWQKTLASWRDLKVQHLSDAHFSAWLQSIVSAM